MIKFICQAGKIDLQARYFASDESNYFIRNLIVKKKQTCFFFYNLGLTDCKKAEYVCEGSTLFKGEVMESVR